MLSVETESDYPIEKAALYERLHAELQALTSGERDFLANTANCAALLYHALPSVNWVGFYFLKGEDLVLGPFQGKPACVRIGPGRGVCGAAAAKQQTLVVTDVHQFPDHIACDSASNAEIVVPLVEEGRLLGVLDIDSPLVGRFDQADAAGLQAMATTLLAASDTFAPLMPSNE